MSVQLAKSSGGGNTTPTQGGQQGRRTPSLSLSGHKSNTASANKPGSSVVNNSNNSTEKNDKTEKSNANNNTETQKLIKNDSNEKNSNELKKDDVQENGFTNGHKKNDNKNDEDKKNVTEQSVPVRESTRNKEKQLQQQLQQQKKDEKVNESPKKAEVAATKSNEKIRKKNEKEKTSGDKGQDSSGNITPKKQEKKPQNTGEKKSQDSVIDLTKDEEKKELSTATVEEEKKTEDANIIPASVKDSRRSSITIENQLAEVEQKDEMEPLVFEGDEEITGHPVSSSTPGKVLKHRLGPMIGEVKQLKEDAHISLGGSAIASSSSSKSISTAPINSFQDSSSKTAAFSSLPRPGKISGRKSFRNLPEVSFENRYPGSYRQIPDDDRWTSSMNVTVGSEIPNESTSTSSYSFFSRGKKRERTPPPPTLPLSQVMGSQDSELSPKSPKRARLDFTSLFGIVASPMTMLRAKFSRTKIQSSSTPNNNDSKTKKHEEDVMNVSGIVADEITTVESISIAATASVENDINIMDDMLENVAAEVAAEIDKDIADNKLFNDDGDDDGGEQNTTPASSNGNINKKRMCNVM